MSDISRQRVGELQRGVFRILLDHPDGLPAKEIIGRMKQAVPPTDFEKSDYPKHPGTQRFGKIIRFSTIAPVKAGWLIKEKGRWYLTEEGRTAYSRFQDPGEFRRESGRLYDQWLDKRPKEAETEEDFHEEIGTTERVAEAASTLEEAEETAWTEIEEYIAAINPYDLQKLVAALLRAMGYHVAWVSPPGPDKGIDIVAHNDPLGTSAPRIKVQVKRRADKISVDPFRSSFFSSLGPRIFVMPRQNPRGPSAHDKI